MVLTLGIVAHELQHVAVLHYRLLFRVLIILIFFGKAVISRGLCARSDLASYSCVHLPTPWAGATCLLLAFACSQTLDIQQFLSLGDVVVLRRHAIPVRDRVSRCIQAPLL